jgi:hypothetical protein
MICYLLLSYGLRKKTGPSVKERRERLNRPQIEEWFEYLYNEMQKREQQLATT